MKRPICAIELALCLREFVPRTAKTEKADNSYASYCDERFTQPARRRFHILTGRLLNKHLLLGRRPQLSFRRRSRRRLPRRLLSSLFGLALGLSDACLIHQFFLAPSVFFRALGSDAVVVSLD